MSHSLPTGDENARVDRRAVLSAVAWSAPVLVTAIAAPHAAASTNEGEYRLAPSCGVPGSNGPGFFLTASATAALPARTTVTVTVTGVATIGEVSVSGVSASVDYLRETSRLIVLTGPLPAGATMTIGTTLSTSVTARWSLQASVTLPSGASSGSSFDSLSCRS